MRPAPQCPADDPTTALIPRRDATPCPPDSGTNTPRQVWIADGPGWATVVHASGAMPHCDRTPERTLLGFWWPVGGPVGRCHRAAVKKSPGKVPGLSSREERAPGVETKKAGNRRSPPLHPVVALVATAARIACCRDWFRTVDLDQCDWEQAMPACVLFYRTVFRRVLFWLRRRGTSHDRGSEAYSSHSR